MEYTIKKDCVKVTDCSKCQVKFNKDNLSFVSDNPTVFSKGNDEDTYQKKVPKGGNYYDVAQRTYLNTDNKNTTKFTLEKQLDSLDEPVRVIADPGGTKAATSLKDIFSKAPLYTSPATPNPLTYDPSGTQNPSTVPASQPPVTENPPAVPTSQPSTTTEQKPGMFYANSPTNLDRQREQLAQTRPAPLYVPQRFEKPTKTTKS